MFDAKRLLDQFIGSQGQGLPSTNREPDFGSATGGIGQILGGNLGGIGGGAVAGGLAALLLGSKSGRKLAGNALQLGGMAVVGALAYKAYRDWQSGKTVSQSTVAQTPVGLLPPPKDTPLAPVHEDEQQALGRHLLRAMIAAAKADGHIDAKEQAAIFAEMDKLPLDADDKAFVMDELRKPLDIDAVAQGARTPEEAAAIYTASLLVIEIDNASERSYLSLLAARLNLNEALVKHLHATIEQETRAASAPAG